MPKQRPGYALSALLCAFILGLPLSAHSEALDDASIRKFYADSVEVMRGDPDKLRRFMEQRLDDDFMLQANSTQIVNGGAPQTGVTKNDKAHTITEAVQGAKMMHINAINNTVDSIKYSDDHKFAYVTDSTTSTGTVDTPAGGGAHFEEGESCVDRLSLDGAMLKMMQSACNDQITIKK